MKGKALIIIVFILVVALILISIKEKYFSILLTKFQSNEVVENSFRESRDYKRELDLYRHYRKKGNIVMLGNSLTYNVDWNELLNRTDVINRGIGNDTTKGFLSRLEYVYNINPKLCFIMGGINDIFKGIEPESTIRNLEQITINLKNKNIKPIVLSILYVTKNTQNADVLNTQISYLNKQLEKICNTSNIEFINLNETLSFKNSLKESYSIDGVHLTGLGYSKWRDAISPVIKRELGN